MKWEEQRRSSNVDDRRSKGGGGRTVRRAGVPLTIGTAVIAVAFLALGGDPAVLIQAFTGGASEAPTSQSAPQSTPAPTAESDRLADFTSVVLADTEDVWTKLFAARGAQYPAPTLVLFSGGVDSRCGFTSSAVGPFYCPGDQQVYIDLDFFRDLSSRFGAPGDFAQAYVIAHEVGHHIQTVTGTNAEVRRAQKGQPKAAQNELSVAMELQADCYAGVWGHHAHQDRRLLEEGDVQEGLRAAEAIGDDTLQKKAQGKVVPESFTHGSAEQRQKWLLKGLRSGDMEACNTFE